MVNRRRVGPPPPLVLDKAVAMARAACESILHQAAQRERDERVRAGWLRQDEDARRCTLGDNTSPLGSGIKSGSRCIYSHTPRPSLGRIYRETTERGSRSGSSLSLLPDPTPGALSCTSSRMPRALPTWAALRDARIRKSVAGQCCPVHRPSLGQESTVE